MARKTTYQQVYLFVDDSIFTGLIGLQWNRTFLHFMSGNKRFFSIRLDTVKKERIHE